MPVPAEEGQENDHDEVVELMEGEDLDIKSLQSYLTFKLKAVSKIKENLESNVEESYKSVNEAVEQVITRMLDVKKQVSSDFDDVIVDRKRELDKVQTDLQNLLSQLNHLSASSSPFRTRHQKKIGEMHLRKSLEDLRRNIDNCVEGSIEDYKVPIKVELADPVKKFLTFYCPLQYFNVLGVEPKDFKLFPTTRIDTNYVENKVWLKVAKIRKPEGATIIVPCSKILYHNFTFMFEIGEQRVTLSFWEMLQLKSLEISESGFDFRLNEKYEENDLLVHVRYCGKEISESPMILSLRADQSFSQNRLPDAVWKLVGTDSNAEVTRTGKNISGLDKSERIAMGYEDSVDSEGPNGELAQEPISSVPYHIRQGPEGSPMVNRHLPLEQPSPVTPASFRPSMNNDVPAANNQFIPRVFSTINLAEHMPPELDLDCHPNGHVDDNGNISMVDGGPDKINEMQKNLSGENGSHNDIKLPVSNPGLNKSVTFGASTTVYEIIKEKPMNLSQEAAPRRTPEVSILDILFDREDLSSKNSNPVDVTLLKVIRKEVDLGLENEVKVTVEQTKTSDGSQALHKSLLNRQKQRTNFESSNQTEEPEETESSGSTLVDENSADQVKISTSEIPSMRENSAWNLSPDSWKKRKEELEKEGNNVPVIDGSNWDKTSSIQDTVCRPEFDLACSDTTLAFIKSLEVGGVPQSVSCNDSSDIFVTDVSRNIIHRFSGWTYKGNWIPKWPSTSSFIAPRYVLCLPEKKVAILDNRALYIFYLSGKMDRTLFEGEAMSFRGLAYDSDWGRIVTSEASDSVVKLLLIDYSSKKGGISKSISLEPTRERIQESKVRFLSCSHNRIYSSDIGLGQLYVTEIKDGTSRIFSYVKDNVNRLKNAMGIVVDAAENVLVASTFHNKVELFDKDGAHCRTFRLPNTESPTGMFLHQKTLYVVDTGKAFLNIYSVAEK